MKRLAQSTGILTLCFAGLFPASAQQTGQTIRHHHEAVADPVQTQVEQAEKAIEKNDYPTAEKSLQEATSKDPRNFRAWYDLGFLYNATNRPSEAIEAYRKSVEANPQVFESNLNLGLLLERKRDPEAAKYLAAAITLKPASQPEKSLSQAYLSLGHVLETTNPEEALKAYRKSAELQPSEAEPHLEAAILLEQQKNVTAASQEFQKALDLDANNRDALAGLVNTYSRSGQLPKAEALLRRMTANEPQNATLHIQLGRVLAAQKKNDDAITELTKGLDLTPRDAAANRELIQLLLDEKKYPEAIVRFKPAIQASPSDPDLHYMLGIAYLRNKNFPEAQAELIQAVKLKSDFGQAYGDLAFAASENKDYKLCAMALDVRAKFLPETPFTYFLRATALDHLHDWPDAITNYEKFLSVAEGKYPDQEWQAKHRLIAIDPKRKK
jgi:tetratricopeptide (TPR) repeat protein